ncbi:MAG: nucleotidyltransferase family protein [Elusimicrobiota bacterium]|nr:nucleotidyltransferase family protein [Elusimicrobiota bacterium]
MDKILKILIGPEDTIKTAFKIMDEAGSKIVFVVGKENILKGALSDGDIRRWILKGGDISAKAKAVMASAPKYLLEGYSQEEAKELVVKWKFECVPVVDAQKRIKGAVWWYDFLESKSNKYAKLNMPVVIMAGGKGARLAPITQILPKPLMPIGDKPVTQHIMERFSNYGCRKIYMSVNFKAKLIMAYFSDVSGDYDLEFIEEPKPLGTAGSLYLLKRKIKQTFFLTNCDVLVDADYADIIKFHRERGNKITIVGSMKHFTIPYGTCEIENGGNLLAVREKPEYDFLVNTGMYVIEPEVLKLIPDQAFLHMTELIGKCLKKGVKTGVYPISEKSWADTGQWEQLQQTLDQMGLNK